MAVAIVRTTSVGSSADGVDVVVSATTRPARSRSTYVTTAGSTCTPTA